MFRHHTMKKTNLKAKKQVASTSAKQLRLDSFFAKKLSPNKENLTNDVEPIDESKTSFMCLSDIYCKGSEDNSETGIEDKTFDTKDKVLGENGSCSSKITPRSNKRKLRSSSAVKGAAEDTFSIDGSTGETCQVAASPRRKKVNLDKSSENFNIPESKKKVRKKLCVDGTKSPEKKNVLKTREVSEKSIDLGTKEKIKDLESHSRRTPNDMSHSKAEMFNGSPKIGKKSSKTVLGSSKSGSMKIDSEKRRRTPVKNVVKLYEDPANSNFEAKNSSPSKRSSSKQIFPSPKSDRRSILKSFVDDTLHSDLRDNTLNLFQTSVMDKSSSLFQTTACPRNGKFNSSPSKQHFDSIIDGSQNDGKGSKSSDSSSRKSGTSAESSKRSKFRSVNNVAKISEESPKVFSVQKSNFSPEEPSDKQNYRSSKEDCSKIFKSVVEETKQSKSDVKESKLLLKQDSNCSSSLFQTTPDQRKDRCSDFSAKKTFGRHDNGGLSNSIIEGTLNPKANNSHRINNRKSLSDDSVSLFQSSSEPSPKKFNRRMSPRKVSLGQKAVLNLSEPLFEDTPVKPRSKSVLFDNKTPSKFHLNDSKSVEESQSETQNSTNFHSVISATPQNMSKDSNFAKPVINRKNFLQSKHSGRMFEAASPKPKAKSHEPLFEDSVVALKSNIEIDSKDRLKVGANSGHCSTPVNHKMVSVSILNESDGSIIESSQVKQPWTMLKDTVKTETAALQVAVSDLDFDDDLLFENWDMSEEYSPNNLALDTMKRCKITDVRTSNTNKIVTVQSCDDEKKKSDCKLQGAWFYTMVEIKDIVNIVAEFKHNEWIIDNTGGLIIMHPDVLISGTSLMGSMFCRRRAVLANSFQSSEAGAKCMVIGSLVHLILQKVMKNNIRREEKIQEIIHDVVFDSNLVRTLLLSQMNFDEAEKELSSFVPEILKFMETYVAPTSTKNIDQDWSGKITSILDIEENIWSPTYGLKGKVDVTVEVETNGQKRIMPFELKTGKSSNSAEHRGQVILYVMMMAQLGYNVDSGLLFYLKDGTIKEVQVDYRVKRDIMMLRNDFVHFIAISRSVAFHEDGSVGAPRLPEPVDHHSACKRCPYQTFCCAALVDDNMKGVHPQNPIVSLSEMVLSHLKSIHVRYVFHWMGLLKVEEADKKFRSSSNVRDLWCSTAEKREENGLCKANLSISKVELKDELYIHQFSFQNDGVPCNFIAGDYVVISSDVRTALVTGSILSISDNNIIIGFEKDLSLREEKLFHMDRYESQTLLNFNLSNLSSLLENTPQANQLRKSVIELQQPSFKKSQLNLSDEIMKKLNQGQKKAVLKAFAAEVYMLIQGMPGCGKTETLAALVKLLVKNGQSILVTSHTHSAVDNLALRLCEHVDLLRIGSKKKVHPSLHEYCEDYLLSQLNFQCLEDVKKFYQEKKVVAVTVLGCSHPILSLRRFDVCIVDEATQVLQPSVLRPLMTADKFILVGDPLQLPPLVYSNFASGLGLSESLFVRLNRPSVTTKLNIQYRMNKRITALANDFMYDGALECANDTVANNRLKFNFKVISKDLLKGSPWLKLALSCEMNHSVVFVNVVDPKVDSKDDQCVNHSEARCIMTILRALDNSGVGHGSIGVIAPYRAQVNLLSQLTTENNFDVEVNTVDQYQGRDKEVVLFSCTAHSNAAEAGILSSRQRLSVAITRAKQKLIFFGDSEALKKFETFKQLLEFLKGDCFLKS